MADEKKRTPRPAADSAGATVVEGDIVLIPAKVLSVGGPTGVNALVQVVAQPGVEESAAPKLHVCTAWTKLSVPRPEAEGKAKK